MQKNEKHNTCKVSIRIFADKIQPKVIQKLEWKINLWCHTLKNHTNTK